jgi:tRNA 2-thiouridine synthesizing protein A
LSDGVIPKSGNRLSDEIVPRQEIIDARGLRCPLPVLQTERRLATLSPGATIVVLATDPIARIDIPLFCTQNGHACDIATEGDVQKFTITKKS